MTRAERDGSKADEDLFRAYELDVSSFITKPVIFERLVEVIATFGQYWFELVKLSPKRPGE